MRFWVDNGAKEKFDYFDARTRAKSVAKKKITPPIWHMPAMIHHLVMVDR